MKIKRREKYTIPTWAAYYFQTGEVSDMSEQEVNICNRWLEARDLKFADVVETEVDLQEPFFCWNNDITNVGETCLDVDFIIFED